MTAHCEDNNEVEADIAPGKRELLRWFPADTETDCEDQPGPEQVGWWWWWWCCHTYVNHSSSSLGERGEAKQSVQDRRGKVLFLWQSRGPHQELRPVEISVWDLQNIIQAGQKENWSFQRRQIEGRQREKYKEKEIFVIKLSHLWKHKLTREHHELFYTNNWL